MSDKFAVAEYLVNLMSIMEGKEDAGRAKGTTLADEYNRQYDRLKDLIIMEEENARKSREQSPAAARAADESERESRRGESDRSGARRGQSGRADVPG